MPTRRCRPRRRRAGQARRTGETAPEEAQLVASDQLNDLDLAAAGGSRSAANRRPIDGGARHRHGRP